jgi:DNA repair exonuclease SbcCD ATPase subunit
MTELETLLLRQLEQQQHDSERLVNGLSGQLERLQTALDEQQTESAALRRELAESDRRHAEAIDALTQQFNEWTARLRSLGQRPTE